MGRALGRVHGFAQNADGLNDAPGLPRARYSRHVHALERGIVRGRLLLEQDTAGKGVYECVGPATARHKATSSNPIDVRNLVASIRGHTTAGKRDGEHGVDDRIRKHGSRRPHKLLRVRMRLAKVAQAVAALVVEKIDKDPHVDEERAEFDNEDPDVM